MSGRRWRMAAAIAFVALLAVGVVWATYAPNPSDGGEPVAVDSPTPTASAEATNAPTAEGTFAPTDEPEPELETTGEDFDRIWRSINEYVNWLYSHPDPDKLERVYDRKCRCFDPVHELLTDYARNGQWWIGARTEVIDVEVLSVSPGGTVAELRVVSRRDAPIQLIDSTGRVFRELPARQWTYEYSLGLDETTGRWLELSFVVLEEEDL